MSLALKQEEGQGQVRLKKPLFVGKKGFTYKDYLNWPDDVRAEIIYGVAYMMGQPSTKHQEIFGILFNSLFNFLKGKTCKVYAAPFGVRLFPKEDRSDNTVVEPDIVVICDSSKIDEYGCNGAPDLVVEILSPSTKRKDRHLKRDLYQKAGVREYWIVSPDDNDIDVHLFEKNLVNYYGKNEPETPEDEKIKDIIPVSVLPGLEINLNEVF